MRISIITKFGINEKDKKTIRLLTLIRNLHMCGYDVSLISIENRSYTKITVFNLTKNKYSDESYAVKYYSSIDSVKDIILSSDKIILDKKIKYYEVIEDCFKEKIIDDKEVKLIFKNAQI